MKQLKVNVKIVPDIRRIKEKGKLPLKLRITYLGKRKYYASGFDASINEWDIINSNEAKGKLRQIKNNIAILEDKASKCCEGIIPFSFKIFEDEFFLKKIQFEDVASAFKYIIEELKMNQQYGTSAAYFTAINSLQRFKTKIYFQDVNKDFLYRYERWMLTNNKSITTVGFYLRSLRAVMNLARSSGIIKYSEYPFGRRKYVIPVSRNIKKALRIEHIQQIFDFETKPYTTMDRAKDFWIFSYLCNGINMMDIVFLRWSEVDEEKIVYERLKTKRSKRDNPVKIIALRNEHMDRILSKWGKNKYSGLDSLVFNIIDLEDDLQRARAKIQQFNKVTNDWLKFMGAERKLPIKLTTYVARHSFATMIVRGGAPMAFASQTLGHSNIHTTQRYFAGFDLKAHGEYAKALTNFTKKESQPKEYPRECFSSAGITIRYSAIPAKMR